MSAPPDPFRHDWESDNPQDQMRRLDEWVRHEVLDRNADRSRQPLLQQMASYRDYDANQIWHMAFLQGNIRDFRRCSFRVKQWSIPLVSGLGGFVQVVAGQGPVHIAPFVALVAAVFFFLLDGYYLQQERAFRALYDAVRTGDPPVEAFSMDTRIVMRRSVIGRLFFGRLSHRAACLRPTVYAVHGPIVVGAIVYLLAVYTDILAPLVKWFQG